MAYVRTAGEFSIPQPKIGSGKHIIATNVDGARNELGNFIGQVVGEDKFKIEMSWDYLTVQQWRDFLTIFNRQVGGKFVNDFYVYDPRVGDWVLMTMYVGDRSARPLNLSSTDIPVGWTECQANLIQV
jgi:hypothetical protein